MRRICARRSSWSRHDLELGWRLRRSSLQRRPWAAIAGRGQGVKRGAIR